jgi:hypothetical protein
MEGEYNGQRPSRLVKRNSMTTSEATDKVRAQPIEGSGFWRSGNQEPRKGKGGRGGCF